MIYVRFPLSLRNVEDLLHERGIDVGHKTVRYWWIRFGPVFASGIRRRRVQQLRVYSNWKGHVDELFVALKNSQDTDEALRPCGKDCDGPFPVIPLASDVNWIRKVGNLLVPDHIGKPELERMRREIGRAAFEAQHQ